MTFEVLKEFEVDTPSGAFTLKEGQVIKLSKEEAIPLINEGKITPIEKVAYKVYSEILQAYLWVVADDEDRETLRASQGITEATYTAGEIKELKKLPKEALKVIHRVKEVFPESTVEEINKNADR